MVNERLEGAPPCAPHTADGSGSRRRGTGTLQLAEPLVDRRRFLSVAGCAAVLVAAGEWFGARLDAGMRTRPDIMLSDAAALPSGEAQAQTAADGRDTLVVKLDDGAVVAFDRRCPHLGCPVLWSREHARFECPCHHAAFDARTGRVLFGPPRHGLTRARVTTV